MIAASLLTRIDLWISLSFRTTLSVPYILSPISPHKGRATNSSFSLIIILRNLYGSRPLGYDEYDLFLAFIRSEDSIRMIRKQKIRL
jgi:hypothetical protein